MKQQHADYEVVPYPKYRQWMLASFRSVRHRPLIHGLLEADVTGARTTLREHQARTGEALSFTAFLATCLGRAVAEHRAVQAFRQGRSQLALFKDVDIYTVIEHDVASQKYVIPHIIRAAQRKNFRELHDEIRAAQRAKAPRILKAYWPLVLPAALFRPFVWAVGRIGGQRPRLLKRITGTVSLTAVGMFGNGAGWGIPPLSPTTLIVTVGGIGQKQVIAEGRTTCREYLCLTVSVDHDIVDGAPAARFTRRLKELIESGYGLGDVAATAADADADAAESEQVGAGGAPRPSRGAAPQS